MLSALLLPCAWAGNRFGVLAGGSVASQPEVVAAITDLGGGWVRVNNHLDGRGPNVKPLLDAGLNLVITFNNSDATNLDTTYGTAAQWPNAGFPFKSRVTYQQDIRNALAAVLPYVQPGRLVWVQCENEVSDASQNPSSRYWRGTLEQYLTQLQAFYEVVRSLSPATGVVLSSFASETLDTTLDPTDPRNGSAIALINKLLTGPYDAVDLHFYGCVESIPSKAQWIAARLAAGKRWISTENGGPDSRCPATPLTWSQNSAAFEQSQAQQVATRLNGCADNGGSVCLWFSLIDLLGESDVFTHLGLLDPSVTPPRKKPAYEAFRQFTSSTVVSVSAASYIPLGPLAAEAITAAFGSHLATATEVASSIPLSTSLGGTTVMVRDSAGTERPAPLFSVAPAQVNYQMPPGTAPGMVRVTVTSGDGIVSKGAELVGTVAPSLFAANGDGQGLAAGSVLRVKPDNTQSTESLARFDAAQNRYVPVPIDLGSPADKLFLILYGTGIRRASSVSASIGGVAAMVAYIGPQGQYAGLDQVNVLLPQGLQGRGELDILLVADGKNSNPVTITVQ